MSRSVPHQPEVTTGRSIILQWCAAPIRAIVAAVRCPRCDASPGFPCRNILGMENIGRKRTRKPRPFYQNYVHAPRQHAHRRMLREQAKAKTTAP